MRTLRPLAAVAVTLAVALGAAGCGSASKKATSGNATSKPTVAGAATVKTISAGKLTVCSDIPYAPFEYEDAGGKLVGIDIDLDRAMAARLGLEPVFKDTDFDGIFAALAAGQCDMISSAVSITEERKANNDFTEPYFAIKQSVLVRKDDAAKYKTLESLAGKTIGVQSETTGEAYAKAHLPAGAKLKSFTGADEMFTALKAGQVDALLQDLPVNAYNAKTSGATAVTVTLPSDPESYGFVVKKGNTALRDALDKALAALRADGTYDKVLKKYLGDDAPTS